MEYPRMTPSEAAAYALAMLEHDATSDEFILREACGVLEDARVVVSFEKRDHGRGAYDYQCEVCSPVECTGRNAFALAGIDDTEHAALRQALQAHFAAEV